MPSRKGTSRACDACSVRKIRCDGSQPCSRCISASWNCTYLKTHKKSGPKGPRGHTAAKIHSIQNSSRATSASPVEAPTSAGFDSSFPSNVEPIDSSLPPESVSSRSESQLTFEEYGYLKAPPIPSLEDLPQASSRVSISTLSRYLEIYQSRAYGIWPVVDTESLIARLLTHQNDMEAYTLACAVCAATITQFQYDDSVDLSTAAGYPPMSGGHFESEAKRARFSYDYQEHPTPSTLLGCFFLHVYSANIGRMSSSTLFLTEAITMAHMVGLHKPTYYESLEPEQQQYLLRIYWLLFITERAHSIQHDVPITLERASDLPPLEHTTDGTISATFIRLCHLFHILDETIRADSAVSRLAVSRAQRRLSQELLAGLPPGNEIQRADISMTQQWMRIYLWQHALAVTNLHTADENDEFSFSFPAKIAKSVLAQAANLSRESLEAHGPGMETKLFDITNTLADVMICVPNLSLSPTSSSSSPPAFPFPPPHANYASSNSTANSLTLGPRDLVASLTSLLASFRGGNPALLSILQDKLTTLGLAVTSPQTVRELSSGSEEEEEWYTCARRGAAQERQDGATLFGGFGGFGESAGGMV
ncbi:uncharacterized protein BDZ99DRAFT_453921 [Mytilinidion resinicola]|uniref:Zn(2)-C6 fungal-type domain-containing protein n=1 Tax=Mytilinidion resinicola TaxID=574789 RepID=A0A6A6Y532_9PEZI|nr:uncharacterized protein BDZ99DRAFT_453921 [Mytilinidion resinicola]KAF2803134.1 hypothetical protein BDZ99DRAFT_453921 [Mytilinidion resinicola]